MDILIDQITSIVGPENLVTNPELLSPYGEGNIGFIPSRLPLMAVRPANVEELKSLLKVATMHKMPVTPFSSSKNGHGASIPTTPGMTIDLRRMSGIQLIDERSRNAIIEAGVTFASLQDQAKQKGLRVMTPVDLPASSSVVSSYLEMSPLYAWAKYGTEFILNMEFLLPGGELQKTGSAIIPVFNEKPYVPLTTVPAYMEKVWFGAQGTLGIATKAVIKLKTDFAEKKVLFAAFPSFSAALPALKEIKRNDIGQEMFFANAAYLAGMLTDNRAQYEKIKADLPPVTLVTVLRGEPERVAYQWADLKDIGAQFKFEVQEKLGADGDASEKILAELDYPEGYERFAKIKGAYNVIPFICMAMQLPMFEFAATQMSGAFGYEKSNIGELLLPVEAGRFHHQYSFLSDPANPKDHLLVKKFYEVLSSTLIKMGGFFSRPYGEWAAQVFAKATAHKAMVKEFKAVIDPEHIMNPGKLDL